MLISCRSWKVHIYMSYCLRREFRAKLFLDWLSRRKAEKVRNERLFEMKAYLGIS